MEKFRILIQNLIGAHLMVGQLKKPKCFNFTDFIQCNIRHNFKVVFRQGDGPAFSVIGNFRP
ncbi:MAG TPA: hypothetical protein DCY86_16605 [Bdellovibrionales bacterium]|nr:hypothetical protein [Bdellovibrionales bacterium]